MKKIISLVVSALVCGYSFAQLTGTYYIPTGTPSFPTVAAAIASLNAQGAGAGGVTFNVDPGYVETFLNPTDGLITAANDLASRQIIFQRNPAKGSGVNPKIYSATGISSYDYIICIGGADYVTFDGIDVEDAVANTAQSAMTEFGFVFAKSDPDGNGTQHGTIKNCTIKLKRSNQNSVGITLRNWKCTSLGTSGGTLNAKNKANSYNSFQGNTITDCFSGIYLMGGGTFEFNDQYNDVGSLAGNTITNFGNTSGSCYGFFCQYQNYMNVANNSITSVVQGGVCAGMEFQVTPNASLNLYGNTISIQYLGTGAFYGIRDFLSNSDASSNTVSIHHNTITGCTYPRANASTCQYMNIGHGGPNVSIYNNSVVNNQYGSDTTISTGEVWYLYVGYYPPELGTTDIYNNTVSNNVRFQSPGGSGGVTRYMRFGPQCNTLNCYGNVCDNNTSTTTGPVYGIDISSLEPKEKNIHDNSFTNLYNANGVTFCMSIDNGINWNIYRNKVLNINGPGPASAIVGMYVGFIHESRSGNIFLYNNTIGDLKTENAESSSAIRGLWVLGGVNSSQVGLYNNTVYMNSSSSGADFGTEGLYLSNYAKIYDIRNNIIVNTSTPNGIGKTVAVYTDSLDFGNLAVTSNNNNYYAGTPSAQRLIFSDGVNNDQTLPEYKSRLYPREYLSVSENPPFVSMNPVDLHLGNTTPTQCESGGSPVLVPIAVLTDMDGESRYPGTGYPVHPLYPAGAPDIGADEFGGIPADLTPPFITYSPLANTALTGDRILTATITDVHGIPATGSGLPMLYYKINSGAWTPLTGTPIGNDKFTYTFGAGTTLGDVVSYYIVAQDSWATPNVGCSPFAGAGGFTSNPPAVAIPPSIPSSYTIVSPICGTFTVGTGGDYQTLTAAINDINSRGVTCPITLLLTSSSYPSETFPIILQPNGGSSSTNTLTIKPATVSAHQLGGIIPGSGVLKINGFDHLILDGSATGGTDQSLTLVNASETSGAHVVGLFNDHGTNPATNITIRNCLIRGFSSTTVTNYGILLNQSGGGYDDIQIMNNTIIGANTGIQFTGNFSGINHNGQITGNVIGSTDYLKYITTKGIVLQYSDNTLIEKNNIMGAYNGNGVPQHAGIYILGYSTNTKIRKNLIHDFYRNVDDGYGAYGIWYEAENNSVTEISNNSIYGIKSSGAAPGVAPNNPYGIFIAGGGNVKILHNSIWLFGNVLSTADVRDGSSSCIGILNDASVTTNIEIRNNILANTMMQLGGGCQATFSIGKTSGIATRASNAGNFSIIDHNDYYMNGCHPYTGIMNSQYYPSLLEWKAATSQEVHSLAVNPVFTSESNLLPTTTTMPKAGTFLSSLPADINNMIRTNPPDMGAYEFSPSPTVVTNSATNIQFTTAMLHGSVTALNSSVNVFFDYGLTTAYGSTVAGIPATVPVSSTQAIDAPVTNLLENTTYHFRLRGVTFANVTVYGNDMTFTTPTSVPANITVTGTVPGPTSPCYNATNTITVAGGLTTFVVQPGGSATFIAGVKILYEPGTTVHEGGYMHGFISTGTYCGSGDASVAAAAEGQIESPGKGTMSFIHVFPNPTTGIFSLEIDNGTETGKAIVEIFNMKGDKVFLKEISENIKNELSLSDKPAGIYLIRVISGKKTGSVRIIKN